MGSTGAVIGAERLQGEQRVPSAVELQQLFDVPAYEPAVEMPPLAQPNEAVFTAGAATVEELASDEYGDSGRLSRAVGALIVKHTVETEVPEVAGFVERGRQEFFSNLTEKLKTHPNLRKYLDSEDEHVYKKINGRIITADGVTPIVDLTGNGARKSREMAEADPRMQPQARSDEIDHHNMRFVEDELAVGESVAFVSVDRKDEFKIDKDFYKNLGVIGYREGLAYIQCFSRLDEDTYVFWTYSVEDSDLDVWRDILTVRGTHIPEGEPTSSWHQYPIPLKGSREEVRTEIRTLRDSTYAAQGFTHKRHSVTEFVDTHEALLNEDFNTFILPLMTSAATGRKEPVIQALVEALLLNPGDMSKGTAEGLRRINRAEDFTEEDRRLIERCITYGAFMKLERRLQAFARGQEITKPVVIAAQRQAGSVDPAVMASQAQAMAGGVHNGLQRGIRVGGCSGEADLGTDRSADGKEKKEESATTDVGREKATEDAAEGGESKTMCCPECGTESAREDVVHMTGPDEGYLECPGCGFFADVCTGESGYRNEHKAEKPPAQDSAAGYLLAALGIKNTALPLGKSLI
jgi:hypothetical protein